MSARPVVSILLPIRDAARTLDRCLASLVEQTFTDWECLAVDDGSTDGSRALLERWAGHEARFRIVESPSPGGIVLALERGRALARGPLLARQDADDWSHPERFAQQVAALTQDPSLGVIGCRTRTPGELSEGMRRYLDWLAACTDPAICGREIWIESPVAHPSAMIRSSVMDEVGGYRDLGWPEDYDLWLRIHRAGWRITNVPRELYEWTESPGRLSRRDPRYAPAAFLRCRVHHLRRWLAERGMARPIVIWGAGRDGRHLARAWEVECDVGEGRASDGVSVVGSGSEIPAPEIAGFVDIDPRKIGRRRRGRPILDPDSARRAFPSAFYLAAVGVPGARELIRSTLREWGLVEGEDFLCVH